MAMRKGLGKGLGALIEDFNEQPNAPGEGLAVPAHPVRRAASQASPHTWAQKKGKLPVFRQLSLRF